jgi:hypothetical protein
MPVDRAALRCSQIVRAKLQNVRRQTGQIAASCVLERPSKLGLLHRRLKLRSYRLLLRQLTDILIGHRHNLRVSHCHSEGRIGNVDHGKLNPVIMRRMENLSLQRSSLSQIALWKPTRDLPANRADSDSISFAAGRVNCFSARIR